MNGLVLLSLVALGIPALHARVAPHIIGGRDATPGEFPWQGSIQKMGRRTPIETYPGHICGCVLVSDTWIVTAAHCLGTGLSGLYVVLGLHVRGDSSVGAPVGYYIEDTFVHPAWNPTRLINDIGLIKLSGQVEMNQFVKAIDMAETGADFDDTTCTISGWGVPTVGSSRAAVILQAADVEVMPTDECRLFWGNVGEGHICVGLQYQRGACHGDSGGPLVCRNVLAGVTSFGQGGCYPSTPSVYTRISNYRDWIKQVSGL